MGLLSRWNRWNFGLCNAIEDRLPESFARSLLHHHELLVAEAMNERPGLRILGGGGSPSAWCNRPYSQAKRKAGRAVDWAMVRELLSLFCVRPNCEDRRTDGFAASYRYYQRSTSVGEALRRL